MKGHAPTLFRLLLGTTLGVFGVFILVFLLVFVGGFWVTQKQTQEEDDAKIRSLLGGRLDQLVEGGQLQGESVNRALSGVLGPSVFVLVFQPDGTLVFWSWKGRTWYAEDNAEESRRSLIAEIEFLDSLPAEDHPVFREHLFDQLRSERKLVPLVRKGTPVGFSYAGHHPFEMVEENLQLLRNLALALVLGLAVAGTAAVALAWRMFRRSAGQAEAVAGGLMAIAGGRRDVTFSPAGSRELEGIAASALTLQEVLVREQGLRRRWTQDVAHDLKTPLAGLRVQLDGLADGVLAADPARIGLLLGEVGRLESLTSDLLVLSKWESPEWRLAPTRVEVGDLMTRLGSSFLPQAQGRPWTWEGTGGAVDADPDLLHRALSNLLSNALGHASGPGGLVTRWQVGSGSFEVVITNPGTLDPRDLPYLFQRLHRGEASRTGRGNGLGLAIAKAVADLHGGTLTLVNGEDQTVVARLVVLSSQDLHGRKASEERS